jgi:hypothetical protein
VPRGCGEEKRMREKGSHREQHSAATRNFGQIFSLSPDTGKV